MTIYICGDSTAASYTCDQAPLTGWGQVLPALLPGVAIDNRAFAGRSTRSFLAEGRLAAIEPLLTPGDLLLIQFGHNDAGDKPERHTEPWADFTDNLGLFIDAALARGAVPVLLTPTCVRLWRDGALRDSLGEYPQAVRALAQKRNVALIDVYREGFQRLNALGDEASKAWYMRLSPGAFSGWPEGSVDDTHTRREGAEAYARIVAEGLRELKLLKQ